MSIDKSLDMMLNPDKYGMKECGWCNGYGSSLKEKDDKCSKCGGSGLVKKDVNEEKKTS